MRKGIGLISLLLLLSSNDLYSQRVRIKRLENSNAPSQIIYTQGDLRSYWDSLQNIPFGYPADTLLTGGPGGEIISSGYPTGFLLDSITQFDDTTFLYHHEGIIDTVCFISGGGGGGEQDSSIVTKSYTAIAPQTQTFTTHSETFNFTTGDFIVDADDSFTSTTLTMDEVNATIRGDSTSGEFSTLAVNFSGITLATDNSGSTVGSEIVLNHGPFSQIAVRAATTLLQSDPNNSSAANLLRFYDADNSNYSGFRNPTTRASNATYIWPADNPVQDEILAVVGVAGSIFTLDWVVDGGGGGGGDSSIVIKDYTASATQTQTFTTHNQNWDFTTGEFSIDADNGTQVLTSTIEATGVVFSITDPVTGTSSSSVGNTQINLQSENAAATNRALISVQNGGDIQLFSNDIFIQPDPLATSNANRVRWYTGNSTNYFSWAAPSSLPGNRFYTWPDNAPTVGDVMRVKTVGGSTGNTEWVKRFSGAPIASINITQDTIILESAGYTDENNTIRVTATGNFTIQGLRAASEDGKRITILNRDTVDTITLADENTTASAADRLDTGSANLALGPGNSASFQYDTTDSRWVMINYNTN